MRLSKLSLVAVSLLATSTFAADTIASMFAEGKVKGEIRGYYMEGNRWVAGTNNVLSDDDRSGFALGGHLKYETAPLYGVSLGGSFYTANGLGLNSDKVTAKGKLESAQTSLLDANGKAIDVLSEAYVQYAVAKTIFKAGRQVLDTPWVNGADSRMIPNSFEAYVLINKDLPDTTLIVAHVQKGKGKATDKFGDITPVNEDVEMLAAVYSGLPGTTLKLFDYYAADTINVIVAEADYATDVAGIKVKAGLRYMNQKDMGDKKAGVIDTDLITGKISGTMDNGVTLELAGATVGDQNLYNPWNDGMTYADTHIYRQTNTANADSIRATVGYDFSKVGVEGLTTSLHYVYTEFDANDKFSPVGITWETDVTSEIALDSIYKIDKNNKVRVRYSTLEYDLEATTHDEFRFYYYFNF